MAKIGTPENPEIIEPSAQQEAVRVFSRWSVARQIVKFLFFVSLPALAVDSLFAYAALEANQESFLPWLVMAILILPAFFLSILAVFANLILWPVLILVLTGRIEKNPLQRIRKWPPTL